MAKEKASDFIGEAEGATDNLKAPLPVEEIPGSVEEMIPDAALQIGIDGGKSGVYAYELAPPGWDKDYRLNLNGVNLEHVGDDEHGRWLYRPM